MNHATKKIYVSALFFGLLGLLNQTHKLAICSCLFACIAALGNGMVQLYGRRRALCYLLVAVLVHAGMAWRTAYRIGGVRLDGMIPVSFLAVFISLYVGMRAFDRSRASLGGCIGNGTSLLIASALDTGVVLIYLASQCPTGKVLALCLTDLAYKWAYSVAVTAALFAFRGLHRARRGVAWVRQPGKRFLRWSAAFGLCVVHQTHAMGLSTGPSAAFTGYAAQFALRNDLSPVADYAFGRAGGQAGWFAKVDAGVLYLKVDALVAAEKLKLSDLRSDGFWSQSICVPVSVGTTFLGLLSPHLGWNFQLPVVKLDLPTKQSLASLCQKKAHSFFVGLGFCHGLPLFADVVFETMFASIPRQALHPDLEGGAKPYFPKRWTLRLGWNLFAL